MSDVDRLYADGVSMDAGARAAVLTWLDRLPASVHAADLIRYAEEIERAAAAEREGFLPTSQWIAFAAELRAVAAEDRDGADPATPRAR